MSAGFFARLRTLSRRKGFESEMDEELRFHLESMIQDNIRVGMNPVEARRLALLNFGGLDKTKEECRDTRHLKPLEDLCRDLRFAMRMFVKSPGSTVLCVLMLAVALGSSAVMFSIIDSVLLLPLPYKGSDRLVRFFSTSKENGQDNVSPADFVDWKHQARSFDGITAYNFALNATLTGKEFPEEIRAMPVTSDFFTVFDVHAVVGRVLSEGDFDPRNNFPFISPPQGAVVLLSHGLWQRRFGGNPGLIGNSITMNGGSFTVVGVLPADFHFSDGPGRPEVDCWLPHVYKRR